MPSRTLSAIPQEDGRDGIVNGVCKVERDLLVRRSADSVSLALAWFRSALQPGSIPNAP
jgi:hypothetical protein